MSLDKLKTGVTGLILVGLVIAALALALDSFQADFSTDNACMNTTGTNSEAIYYNATARTCMNSTSTVHPTTHAFNTTIEGLVGTGNASGYLSTIGTLIGVAALIAVVVSAFMFARR